MHPGQSRKRPSGYFGAFVWARTGGTALCARSLRQHSPMKLTICLINQLAPMVVQRLIKGFGDSKNRRKKPPRKNKVASVTIKPVTVFFVNFFSTLIKHFRGVKPSVSLRSYTCWGPRSRRTLARGGVAREKSAHRFVRTGGVRQEKIGRIQINESSPNVFLQTARSPLKKNNGRWKTRTRKKMRRPLAMPCCPAGPAGLASPGPLILYLVFETIATDRQSHGK